MARLAGIEPALGGVEIRCLIHSATVTWLASGGADGGTHTTANGRTSPLNSPLGLSA